MGKKKPIEKRFWGRVRKTETCWLWTGGIRAGYGIVWNHGKTCSAHRISWEIHFGRIKANLLVLHRCDVPNCVRPDHLFLGTHKENTQDMMSKGRNSHGTGAHAAKLTDAAVAKILADTRTHKKIAETHGVDESRISRIKLGKAWKHAFSLTQKKGNENANHC